MKHLVTFISFLIFFLSYSNLLSQTPENLSSLTHSLSSLSVTIWNDGMFGPHHEPSRSGNITWNGTSGVYGSSCSFGTQSAGSVNGSGGFGAYFIDMVRVSSKFADGFTEETVGSVTFDKVTTAVMRDDNATVPYGFDIIQKTYSRIGDNVVFCRNGYVNTTRVGISDLYSQIGADIAIGDYNTNCGGVDTTANLVYVYEPGTSNPYFGFAAIKNLSGCKVGTKKYSTSTQLREAMFTMISTIDTSASPVGDQFGTIGSFIGNISVGDTVWDTYAILAGSNFEELRENAVNAFEIAREAGWTDKIVSVSSGVTDDNLNPQKFALYQNYPNPFNPTTSIKYSIPKQSYVTLKIFDILGKEVRTLANKQHSIGSYEVQLNANNLSSGIYFYTLTAGDFIETKKMILLR